MLGTESRGPRSRFDVGSRPHRLGTVALVAPASIGETGAMRSHRCPHPCPAPRSAFAGFRFPPEVIALAVRWYLRFALSYRDVEELLAERGIQVDHVSIYRWVQRFAPEFAEAARARQHVIADRWHVDETYLKVGGIWRYLFRAIDQCQVIDVFLSPRRDAKAARCFFERAIDRTRISPVEVTTDRYRAYPRIIDDLLPAAFHDTEAYANNPHRDRPRTPEGPASTHERTEARPHRECHCCRTCLRPERPQGLLRPGDRRFARLPPRCRVRRAGSRDLIDTSPYEWVHRASSYANATVPRPRIRRNLDDRSVEQAVRSSRQVVQEND